MSMHLHSIPEYMDMMDDAVTLDDLNDDSQGVNFKISTQIDDHDLMSDILATKLLGFKNKRTLQEFFSTDQSIFRFNQNNKLDITFGGKFDKNQAIQFVNNFTIEFLSQTNRLDLYNEIPIDMNKLSEIEKTIETDSRRINLKDKTTSSYVGASSAVEEVQLKKFKLTSNMKDKELINEIMKESYLGYNSRQELEKFISSGNLSIEKSENDTYEFIFYGYYDEEEATRLIQILTEEYQSKVQEMTYEKVIEKIKEKNFNLESEIVDSDDSLVLTVNID